MLLLAQPKNKCPLLGVAVPGQRTLKIEQIPLFTMLLVKVLSIHYAFITALYTAVCVGIV